MGWLAVLVDWFKGEPEIEFTKPKRHVNRVFLHCSASDNPAHDSVEVIRDWHVNGNKWADVGYHYYIEKNGRLATGRPLSKNPGAQYPHNTATIAICLGGLEEFTSAQFDTLKRLCVVIEEAYDGVITFHGHTEVANKTCPVFPYKTILQLDKQGLLGL